MLNQIPFIGVILWLLHRPASSKEGGTQASFWCLDWKWRLFYAMKLLAEHQNELFRLFKWGNCFVCKGGVGDFFLPLVEPVCFEMRKCQYTIFKSVKSAWHKQYSMTQVSRFCCDSSFFIVYLFILMFWLFYEFFWFPLHSFLFSLCFRIAT